MSPSGDLTDSGTGEGNKIESDEEETSSTSDESSAPAEDTEVRMSDLGISPVSSEYSSEISEDVSNEAVINESTKLIYDNLQAAINDAESGDTIRLLKDFTATGEEKPAWADWLYEIRAAKISELTIDLDGHTVDCGDQYSWLRVNSGSSNDMTLTVRNGTIQNTVAGPRGSTQGSAIWAWNTLNLDGVTFSNCTSPGQGGAVYVGTSDNTTVVDINNCVFEDCSGSDGGAIAIYMAKQGEIKDTQFRGNSSTNGGAIYVDHGADGVVLKECTFIGNTASSGGAVYALDNCSLTLNDCDFSQNNATQHGGAVYNAGLYVAGALEHPGQLTVNGGSFDNNTAAVGGAIMGSYLLPSTLTNVTFNGNIGDNFAGALYIASANLDVDNCKFTKNTGTNNGGAAYIYSGNLKMTDCDLFENGTQVFGGALYLQQVTTTISGGKIIGNTASTGGGIANYYGALTLADNAEIHNNAAYKAGDDIFSSDANNAGYPAKLTLIDAASTKLLSDDRDITGWFVDEQNARWSVENNYEEFDFQANNGQTGIFALKAAHSQYFTVTYTDGVDGEVIFEDQVKEVVAGDKTPAFEGTPVCEGYEFIGWSPAVAETVTGNAVYTARWKSAPGESSEPSEPSEPSQPSEPSEPSTPSEPTFPYYPDRPSTPAEDIEDDDTPLVSTPEESGEETVDEEITEEETPLASTPVEEEKIDDDSVPLVDAPKTGVMAGGAAATLAAASAAAVLLGKKRRK